MFRRGGLINKLRKYYTLTEEHIKELSKIDKSITYMFVTAEQHKTNYLLQDRVAVIEKFNITIEDAINFISNWNFKNLFRAGFIFAVEPDNRITLVFAQKLKCMIIST